MKTLLDEIAAELRLAYYDLAAAQHEYAAARHHLDQWEAATAT